MYIELKKIEENLTNFWNELINLKTTSKHYNSPNKYGKQGLERWKDRLIAFLEQDITEEEADKFKTIKYPRSIMTRDTDPFTNFDSEVDAYCSYLANLIKDLQSNPPYWLNIIKSTRIKIQNKERNTKRAQDLANLHPNIYSKCHELYEKGAYPEAVEKGFKVVRDKLRELTGHEKGSDAFGKGKLHIKGAAANHVDDDFNEGVKFLTMAIDRFRNEKSHTSDAQIEDPTRAFEYLTLCSLAMRLDNAEILQ